MRFVFHRRTSIELNTRAHVSAVHGFSSELLFVFELYQVKRTQKRSFFFFTGFCSCAFSSSLFLRKLVALKSLDTLFGPSFGV